MVEALDGQGLQQKDLSPAPHSRLPGEREAEAEAEVLRDGGEGVVGEQGRIALAVIVEAEGDKARHGVVALETGLDGAVARGGFRESRLDVARQRTLVAEGEVEAQVKGMREVRL